MADEELTADDLEIEVDLRSAGEAAERLVVLGAVCRRAFLEDRPGDVSDEEPAAERFDLLGWLRSEGLETAVVPSERRVLEAGVGRLEPEVAGAASWRSEGMVALGWALGLVEAMPTYEGAADPAALLAVVPAPWEATASLRSGACLRREEEIAAERERAELWHWRAETADLLADATGSEREELMAVIRDVTREAVAAGLIAALAGDDFVARGHPYRDLHPAALEELGAVAAERHRALNWLCGFGATWDDVPTDR